MRDKTGMHTAEQKKVNYSQKKIIRYAAAFGVLAVFLGLLLLFNICMGSVKISPAEIWKVFSGGADDTAADIILELRMPRAAAAAVLGGALALSGYLLQTFFNNPIAGPFVLGISSGAKLVVALCMVFFLQQAVAVSSVVLILAAFAGAMISMGFVLLMSKYVNRMSMLVVSGVMIGYICSAITDFVVTFASDADIVNLRNWSMGSFSGITWGNVRVMSVVVSVSFLFILFLAKPMNAYQMGEGYAKNSGVNLKLFRCALVLFSSLLSACVTAFAGPVSFVGIAVPQLVKQLFKSSKPILMIPACFLGGAVFCLFCDLIARTLLAPTELSISTVTAILGAPVVIAVLLGRQKETGLGNSGTGSRWKVQK